MNALTPITAVGVRDDLADAMVRRAAASTVEALVYGLREGIEKISEGERMRRLSELSEAQLCEVCERLQNFRPDIAPAWAAEEIEALMGIWGSTHEHHEAI
jgi:hypothetical protein